MLPIQSARVGAVCRLGSSIEAEVEDDELRLLSTGPWAVRMWARDDAGAASVASLPKPMRTIPLVFVSCPLSRFRTSSLARTASATDTKLMKPHSCENKTSERSEARQRERPCARKRASDGEQRDGDSAPSRGSVASSRQRRREQTQLEALLGTSWGRGCPPTDFAWVAEAAG